MNKLQQLVEADELLSIEHASTVGDALLILEFIRKTFGDIPIGSIIFNDCNCDDSPCDHLNTVECGLQINLAIVDASNQITESDARRPGGVAPVEAPADGSYFVTIN